LEKAVSTERSRLARNLHDSVTQTIFSVTLTAEAAKILIDQDKEQTVEQLDKLLELSGSALAEMRSLIFELRPTAVAELGILPALNQYIARLDEFNNLKVDLHVQGEPNLEDLEAQRLFFVIREALNNIVKHADVDEAAISLDFGNDRVLLKVEDHGKGFDPSSIDPTKNKMGLASMRERVEKFGGTLVLDSQIGIGTKISVEIPVIKESADDN
jgi:signal transduction histidine kinase